MKKLVAILMTILMLFSLFQGALRGNVVKAGEIASDDFLGYWVNDNVNTPGITRIAIKIEGEEFIVTAFGRCSPTDCDWGNATTSESDSIDGILNLKWVFDFATADLSIKLTAENKAEVTCKHHYTDNSGRQDYITTEYFTKKYAGNIITIATTGLPESLFGIFDNWVYDLNFMGAIYASLIGETPDGNLFTDLLEKVPNINDGSIQLDKANSRMTVTYTLKDNLYWSDGKPITSHDLYFTWKMVTNQSFQSLWIYPFDEITSIETPSSKTAIVHFNTIDSSGIICLSIYPSHILEPIYNSDPTKLKSCSYNTNPIHAGPYMLDEFTKDHVILVPNPYYYAQALQKNTIIFEQYPDIDSLINAILTNTVDIVLPISLGISDINKLKTIGIPVDYDLFSVTSTYWEHLELNTTDPILSDVRVRRAISAAINRQEISDIVFSGYRPISLGTYFIPNNWATDPNAVLPDNNIMLANQLLDDADWKIGSDGYRYKDGKKLTLELSSTTSQNRKDESVVVQAQLKKVGIEIVPKYLNSTYFYGTYITHRMFQVALFTWGIDPVDPDGFTLYHSSQIPTEANGWAGQNYTGISDPTLDDAIYKATHEFDRDVKKSNYFIVQQRLINLVPQIGLHWWNDFFIARKTIHGIDYKISGVVPLTWNIQNWYVKTLFTIDASAGSSGTISSSGTVSVNYGDSKTFTITPNLGYKIKDVLVDGTSVGTVSTYTFTNVTSDHTIQASFEQLTFKITASAGSSGTISPSGTITVNYGDSKTFTISPFSGYRISTVKVDGKSIGAVSSYTFTNITQDHTIEAIFEKENKETVIILQIGNTTFTVNGSTRTLDSPPIIKNGRTLLPIRAVVEALGGTAGWDATERKVTVTLSSTTIELWIGKSIAKVNGIDTPIDATNSKVVPEIINSRTMLPLRFVAESLDCTVEWDGTTKTITITYSQ